MVMSVWGDMVLLIGTLQTTLPQLMVSIKYVIMRWKRTVVLSIINMMVEDWMAFKQDTERNVMIRRARTARLITIISYVLIATGFLTLTIPPYFGVQVMYTTNFTDRSKPLPLETYYFYDSDKSPQYELTFFVHAITVLLSMTIYMCVDLFLLLIILHICGQLENFKCRLVNLVSCKNFNKVLNNTVATHLRLIRFADNIENTYSLMMLITIFHFGVVFCLSGFLFTNLLSEKKIDETVATKLFYSTIILVALLMNTFLYCVAGEFATEQCNAVYHALCDLEWYKLESKEARNLILLMIRTKHPFRITAGKIIPLTMTTFCSVLKTSCGYLSFLLTKHV